MIKTKQNIELLKLKLNLKLKTEKTKSEIN